MTPHDLYNDIRFRHLIILGRRLNWVIQHGSVAGGMIVTMSTTAPYLNPYARIKIRMGERVLRGFVAWGDALYTGWWPDVTEVDLVELRLRLA